jgi:hypothetical protein
MVIDRGIFDLCHTAQSWHRLAGKAEVFREYQKKHREERDSNMKMLKEELGGANHVQEQYFEVTDKVPEGIWYWASLVSIIGSMVLFFGRKRQESLFIGQWAPTFLLFGLFHKLLKPSR